MNKIKQLAFLLVAFTSFALLSCGGGGGGGDDTPQLTEEEQRLLDLAGTTGITYEAVSVTRDSETNNEYDDFTLFLKTGTSSNTYTTTDGDPIFDASGTWSVSSSNINQVTISRGSSTFPATMSNFNAAAGTFTLTINYTAQGGAAAGLSGTYVFNMEKQ